MIKIEREGDKNKLTMQGDPITLLEDAVSIVHALTSVVFEGEDGEKILDTLPARVRDFREGRQFVDATKLGEIFGGSHHDC